MTVKQLALPYVTVLDDNEKKKKKQEQGIPGSLSAQYP